MLQNWLTWYYSRCDHQATNFVIFTDSLSALQALENFSSSQDRDICRLAQSLNKLLTCYDVQATLQWIPGHEDVSGNERADQLAKEGAKKEQYEKQCSYPTARKIIRNNFKEAWMDKWKWWHWSNHVHKHAKTKCKRWHQHPCTARSEYLIPNENRPYPIESTFEQNKPSAPSFKSQLWLSLWKHCSCAVWLSGYNKSQKRATASFSNHRKLTIWLPRSAQKYL